MKSDFLRRDSYAQHDLCPIAGVCGVGIWPAHTRTQCSAAWQTNPCHRMLPGNAEAQFKEISEKFPGLGLAFFTSLLRGVFALNSFVSLTQLLRPHPGEILRDGSNENTAGKISELHARTQRKHEPHTKVCSRFEALIRLSLDLRVLCGLAFPNIVVHAARSASRSAFASQFHKLHSKHASSF